MVGVGGFWAKIQSSSGGSWGEVGISGWGASRVGTGWIPRNVQVCKSWCACYVLVRRPLWKSRQDDGGLTWQRGEGLKKGVNHEHDEWRVCAYSLQPHGLQPTRLLCPWDSPGKNTGMGGHFLLQGNFPTPGLNPRLPCLLRWRQVLYHWAICGAPTSAHNSHLFEEVQCVSPSVFRC